jgi:Domain of unknown function (DUF1816)
MNYLPSWLRSGKVCRLATALAPDPKPKQPWWVEVQTSVPRCTYYFGPFDNHEEARESREGYVQDLRQEGARDIVALVKQCQPDRLTIDQGYYSVAEQIQQ